MKRSPLAAALILASLMLTVTAVTAQPPAPPPAATAAPAEQPPKIELKLEYPAPPVDGIYVSDRGVILSLDEQTRINKAAAKVKLTTSLPVMIVTIRSLEAMGADPAVGLEPYAREVFNQWSIGSAKDNRGVLMLLSRDDNQARVVMGAGWPPSQEGVAKRISDRTLVPALAANKVADGILTAINEAEAMFIAAGYPTEMPPAIPETTGGKLVDGGTPVPLTPPQPTFTGSLGAWVWIGAGLVLLVVIIFLVAMSRASSRG